MESTQSLALMSVPSSHFAFLLSGISQTWPLLQSVEQYLPLIESYSSPLRSAGSMERGMSLAISATNLQPSLLSLRMQSYRPISVKLVMQDSSFVCQLWTFQLVGEVDKQVRQVQPLSFSAVGPFLPPHATKARIAASERKPVPNSCFLFIFFPPNLTPIRASN